MRFLPVFFGLFLLGCGEQPGPQTPEQESAAPATGETAPEKLGYVGSSTCGRCHAKAYADWQESHHAQAMAEASADNVLADFTRPPLDHFADETQFIGSSQGPALSAVDGTGQRRDFPVTHTFGVSPLQQYLVPYGSGRYQAHTAAWDSRPRADGGQRWFHLQPDIPTPPGDPLHWAGELQNWNSQCAECHSTGLIKGYSVSDDSYDTRWEEISVGCEACHGRGSRHLAWASGRDAPNRGFEIQLAADPGQWQMELESGIARRSQPPQGSSQLQACGRCHARRATFGDTYPYGRHLLDTHQLSLLQPGLYFPDGQIRDEVFVYGSFAQSAMHRAGVRCSDCHEPHSGELLASGNALCAQCHLPQRFDDVQHHGHPAAAPRCVDCHMPKRLYMVVDGRGDHSFRVPRPDLARDLGTPSACQDCHSDKNHDWAAEQVRAWHPEGRWTRPHFGSALAAAWNGAADANNPLGQVIQDQTLPPIVRGSALRALQGRIDSPRPLAWIKSAAAHADPLIRLGALQALAGLPASATADWLLPLLNDPVRAIRQEAVSLLAETDGQLGPQDQAAFDRAAAEYVAAQRFALDRDSGYLNLAGFRAARGDQDSARRTFRSGLERFPGSVPLLINWGDFQRAAGDNVGSLQTLLRARALAPESVAVREAVALAHVRLQDYPAAISELQDATRRVGDARLWYLLALALERVEQRVEAVAALEQALGQRPDDLDGLVLMVALLRDMGQRDRALGFAQRLQQLRPNNPGIRQLLQSVQP
ncbi:MAG: HEAT repeat domain-containing protein [Xanthomonadales bacterium]|nr:HEAT repeat domain-containing protein [Xanthomonadales bacterium]